MQGLRVLRRFSPDLQEHLFKKTPILEAIIQMFFKIGTLRKYAANFWKSIFGVVHFRNIACSTRDFQKFATYLQNKNTSGDCLCYLKEHLWLG